MPETQSEITKFRVDLNLKNRNPLRGQKPLAFGGKFRDFLIIKNNICHATKHKLLKLFVYKYEKNTFSSNRLCRLYRSENHGDASRIRTSGNWNR